MCRMVRLLLLACVMFILFHIVYFTVSNMFKRVATHAIQTGDLSLSALLVRSTASPK